MVGSTALQTEEKKIQMTAQAEEKIQATVPRR
jgi:hypothetical protein